MNVRRQFCGTVWLSAFLIVVAGCGDTPPKDKQPGVRTQAESGGPKETAIQGDLRMTVLLVEQVTKKHLNPTIEGIQIWFKVTISAIRALSVFLIPPKTTSNLTNSPLPTNSEIITPSPR